MYKVDNNLRSYHVLMYFNSAHESKNNPAPANGFVKVRRISELLLELNTNIYIVT